MKQSKITKKVSAFPQDVRKAMYDRFGLYPPKNWADPKQLDPETENTEITKLDSADITWNGFVVLPGHDWDLREANMEYPYLTNLRLLKTVSFLAGPRADIYEKIDASKPVTIVIGCDSKYYYYEF